jgi:protein gp37
MSLKKVKSGSNMYQGWVTHTHSLLGGKCSHECSYCYVQSMAKRYPSLAEKYSGDIRLLEKELDVAYGKDKSIFIEHCNDLFAENVPCDFINRILKHCGEYPENTYIFQTKNPNRFKNFLSLLPENFILGTTMETNRNISDISSAPPTVDRYNAIKTIDCNKFITIEPILKFDVDVLVEWISNIKPNFVNIGADSKGSALQEPAPQEIKGLISELARLNIEIKEKHNLQRLLET